MAVNRFPTRELEHAAPSATPEAPQHVSRVVFLTDIPTPYMVAVFEALSELVDLHVVFCAESSSRGSGWEFGELPFSSEVVAGTTIWTEHPDAINYFLSPRILLAVARRRPEAIISAGYSVPALYANAWAAASRTPLAIQSDGTPFSERSLSRVQRAARALLLRLASAAVANSRESVERFVELGVRRDRIFSAPHSTNVERFQRAARERRRGADAPVRVLAVGRLLPRKGLDRLVRAMGRVAREQDVQLVLAGSGPEEGSLRRLAAEVGVDTEFIGFVDQPELVEVYRDADVFAFPTLDDPFGLVLLEAAAAGLPLVSSPFAGATADVVDDGRTGFVANPYEPDHLADVLLRLAGDRDLRERMGAAAFALAAERTPRLAAEGYLAAVRAMRARRGRARSLLRGGRD